MRSGEIFIEQGKIQKATAKRKESGINIMSRYIDIISTTWRHRGLCTRNIGLNAIQHKLSCSEHHHFAKNEENELDYSTFKNSKKLCKQPQAAVCRINKNSEASPKPLQNCIRAYS